MLHADFKDVIDRVSKNPSRFKRPDTKAKSINHTEVEEALNEIKNFEIKFKNLSNSVKEGKPIN